MNQKTDITVQPVALRELSAVAALERVCFSDPWSEELLLAEWANKDCIFLSCREANQLIGYACLQKQYDEGHITSIAVSPEYRRKGIGRLLLESLLQAGEEQGICQQTLEVRVSNKGAVKLYEQLGFQSAGIRKGYYWDNGEDALIMWRNRNAT